MVFCTHREQCKSISGSSRRSAIPFPSTRRRSVKDVTFPSGVEKKENENNDYFENNFQNNYEKIETQEFRKRKGAQCWEGLPATLKIMKIEEKCSKRRRGTF